MGNNRLPPPIGPILYPMEGRPPSPKPKLRPLPLGEALQSTVARMKEIAAQSGDSLLLANGPPHPDHELLDTCAEAMQQVKRAKELWAQWEPPDSRNNHLLECQAADARTTQLLRRAGRIRATTAAGIFAKALLVRCSRTIPVGLAITLAEDLIDNPVLRRSLWPTTSEKA